MNLKKIPADLGPTRHDMVKVRRTMQLGQRCQLVDWANQFRIKVFAKVGSKFPHESSETAQTSLPLKST